ncbi:hypothetical protein [Flavobacterium sp.]|uniref:hypothetical protein n=1 Tax=Flavobacterium sp. TaxID=239 RepID=UPI003D6B0854
MEIGENYLSLINSEGSGEGAGAANEGGDNNNGEGGAGDNNQGGEGAGGSASEGGEAGDGSGTGGEGGAASGQATGDDGASGEGAGAGTVASDDYDDSKVLDFFLKKGKTIASIDDLFKEPEPKTVNPYENISAKAKGFLDYHTETGRDIEDYQKLQQDISKISDLDLARERVRQDTGNTFTNEQIDSYLEKKLQIDLSDLENLDIADQIELQAYAKSVREHKIAEQEKYKEPIVSNNPGKEAPIIGDDMIRLESGEVMKKEVYEKILSDRQNYLDGLKNSADKITGSSFEIKVDDNGTEKVLAYSYDFSKEDKQEMLASAEDLSNTVKTLFQTEEGFNHPELVEGMFWLNRAKREKAIAAIVHKALAERTEELMKVEGNINLGANPDLPKGKDGKKIVPILQNDGFGVTGNF